MSRSRGAQRTVAMVLFATSCSSGSINPGLAPSDSVDGGAIGAGGSAQPAGDAATSPNDAAVGAVTGVVATKLSPLPKLDNVVAVQREDSVGIDFDPVDGAMDYRVYPLPDDADITLGADGLTTVRNATYRCAGLRQSFDLPSNLNASDTTLVTAGGMYQWKAQIAADPTLGYVYREAAPDRVAVCAVAGYQMRIDAAWRESRFKIYTTDPALRQMLLDQSWRDDGIVFYVPKTPGAGTKTIYSSQVTNGANKKQFYFGPDDQAVHMKDTTPPSPAFQVLSTAADGTEPLMAVNYAEEDNPHVELAVGKERFHRAAYQGNGPLWHVEWAGLTKPTTLVVEALASGCPYQGFLSPQHLEAPTHQNLLTLDDLKSTTPSGEVFINGQYDTPALPKAVARSFVQVAPQPHKPVDWDWYQGFNVGADPGPFKETAYPGCKDSTCGRWQSTAFDLSAWSIDNPSDVRVFTYGEFLGQFWLAFDDWGHDVTGKVRLTALQKATVDQDPTKFLHVTWSVDIVGTDRRYPQLIVSDQDAPVQTGFANPANNSLLVQSIDGPSMRLEAQAIHGLVNGNPWDINNQSAGHVFLGARLDQVVRPTEPLFEHAGMDRMTKFDVYVSSQRLYVFFDGTPAGCTQYPSTFALRGPVTITFGDTLYHEGAADEGVCQGTKPYSFLHAHQCTETKRHFDDLGFKGGVAAPVWDEAKLPCESY